MVDGGTLKPRSGTLGRIREQWKTFSVGYLQLLLAVLAKKQQQPLLKEAFWKYLLRIATR